MNIKLRTVFYFVALLVAVNACRQEAIELTPNAEGNILLPDGRIRYSLYTQEKGFIQPITKSGSAKENAVDGAMWVFVFDATTSDTLFLEAVKAADHEAVGTGASRRTIDLTPRAHRVTLVVLNNAPTHYFDGVNDVPITDDPSSWGLTSSTTISEASKRLKATPLLPIQKEVPYTPNLPIPMSEKLHLMDLSSTTSLGSVTAPLELKRMVARVVVKKNFTSEVGNAQTPPFDVWGATIFNAPRTASLFSVLHDTAAGRSNYLADYDPDTEPELFSIRRISASDALNITTEEHPIYLYPSHDADPAKQPFVIIAAYYNNGYPCYYKLVPQPPLSYFDRNVNYTFLINSVTGPGYPTIAQAAAAPPSNLTYKMQVTDLTGHDVIDNGQYFLALSNSEYQMYYPSTGSINGLTVCTITHNAPAGVVGKIAGASIASPAGGVITGDGTVQTIPVVINNLFDATITIQIGSLVKKLVVRRYYTDAHFNSWSMGIVGQAEFIDPTSFAPVAPPSWIEFNYSSLGDPAQKEQNLTSFQHANVHLFVDEFVNTSHVDAYAERKALLRVFSFRSAPSGAVGNVGNVGNVLINYTQPSAQYVGLFGGQNLGTAVGYGQKLFIERYQEIGSQKWSSNTTTLTGVLGDVYNGRQTTYELAIHPSIVVNPARYCRNKNRDTNGNGTIDLDELKWYLPSSAQLKAIWVSHAANTSPLNGNNYWCTEEFNASRVATQSFLDGEFIQGNSQQVKTSDYYVRCVRELL